MAPCYFDFKRLYRICDSCYNEEAVVKSTHSESPQIDHPRPTELITTSSPWQNKYFSISSAEGRSGMLSLSKNPFAICARGQQSGSLGSSGSLESKDKPWPGGASQAEEAAQAREATQARRATQADKATQAGIPPGGLTLFGFDCSDVVIEAMEAMSLEPPNEPIIARTASLTGSLSSSGSAKKRKIEPGKFDPLLPSTARKIQRLASKIVVPSHPEEEPEEIDDGSVVAFRVNIKPPPPILSRYINIEAANRLCNALTRMVEVRAAIHRFTNSRVEFAVGFPILVNDQNFLSARVFSKIQNFINYTACYITPLPHRKSVRRILTDLEVLVEIAQASLDATEEAAENSQSKEEDDRIRCHFHRWLLQVFADLENLGDRLTHLSIEWAELAHVSRGLMSRVEEELCLERHGGKDEEDDDNSDDQYYYFDDSDRDK